MLINCMFNQDKKHPNWEGEYNTDLGQVTWNYLCSVSLILTSQVVQKKTTT